MFLCSVLREVVAGEFPRPNGFTAAKPGMGMLPLKPVLESGGERREVRRGVRDIV